MSYAQHETNGTYRPHSKKPRGGLQVILKLRTRGPVRGGDGE